MGEGLDPIHARLLAWAHWLTLGGNGDGYAAMSVLHPEWQPPTPGTTPTLKVGSSDAHHRATHAAVLTLSRRLQATLLVHYCKRLTVAEQAEQLECAEPTVHARVREARKRIAAVLSYS